MILARPLLMTTARLAKSYTFVRIRTHHTHSNQTSQMKFSTLQR